MMRLMSILVDKDRIGLGPEAVTLFPCSISFTSPSPSHSWMLS